MAIRHPDREIFAQYLDEIRSMAGIGHYALITRDGTLVEGRPKEAVSGIFAAMAATLLASAEAAAGVLALNEPTCCVSHSKDARLLVLGAGDEMLVTATVHHSADFQMTVERLQNIATRIGEGLKT